MRHPRLLVATHVAALALCLGCTAKPEKVSVDFSNEHCRLSGSLTATQSDGGTIPLGLSSCLALWSTLDNDNDELLLAFMTPGSSGSLAGPGKGWFNLSLVVENDFVDTHPAFSLPGGGSLDISNAQKEDAGTAYGTWIDPKGTSTNDAEYVLGGAVSVSGFEVQVVPGAPASGTTKAADDTGSLKVSVDFKEATLTRQYGSSPTDKELTLSGTLQVTAETKPVLASCHDSTTGICTELLSDHLDAFKKQCNSEPSSTFSTGPCQVTARYTCLNGTGTSSGVKTKVSLYFPSSFCSNYPGQDLAATCSKIGGSGSGSNCN